MAPRSARRSLARASSFGIAILVAMTGAGVAGGDTEVRGALDELLQRMQALGMAAGDVSPDAADAATAMPPVAADAAEMSKRGSFFGEEERPATLAPPRTREELIAAGAKLEQDLHAQKSALEHQFRQHKASLQAVAEDMDFDGLFSAPTSQPPASSNNYVNGMTPEIASGVGFRNSACQEYCSNVLDNDDNPITEMYACMEACPQLADLNALKMAARNWKCLGANTTHITRYSAECKILMTPLSFGNAHLPELPQRRIPVNPVVETAQTILRHTKQSAWQRVLRPGRWSASVAAPWLQKTADLLQKMLRLASGMPTEAPCRVVGGDPAIEVAPADVGTNKRLHKKLLEIDQVAISVERITRGVFYATLNWIDYKIQTRGSILADGLQDYYSRSDPTLELPVERPARPHVVLPDHAVITKLDSVGEDMLVNITMPHKTPHGKTPQTLRITVPVLELTGFIPLVQIFASEPLYSRRSNYGSDASRPVSPVPFKAFALATNNATRHLLLYRQIAEAVDALRIQITEVRENMRSTSDDPDGQPFVESPDTKTAAIAERLQNSDSNVRRAAVEALGKLGDHAAPYKTAIMGLLEDTDETVREVAAKALVKLRVPDEGIGCDKASFVRALEVDGPVDKGILSWFMVSCSKSGMQCRLRCKRGYQIQGGLGDGNITYSCSHYGTAWVPVSGSVRFDPFRGMVPCGEQTKVEGCDVPLMDFGVGRLYSCLDVKKNPWIIFGKEVASECGGRCSTPMDTSEGCSETGIVSHIKATVTNHNPLMAIDPVPESGEKQKVSCRAANPWGAISLKIPPNGVEMCIRTCTRSQDTVEGGETYSGFYPPGYVYDDRAYMAALIDLQSEALGVPPDYSMHDNKPIFVMGKSHALAAAGNSSVGRRLTQILRDLHGNGTDATDAKADLHGNGTDATDAKVDLHGNGTDATDAKVGPATNTHAVDDVKTGSAAGRKERKEISPERIQILNSPGEGTASGATRKFKGSMESRKGESAHFSSMKTKELRQLLETFKIDTTGAIEKQDLVQLAVERGIRAHSMPSDSSETDTDADPSETVASNTISYAGPGPRGRPPPLPPPRQPPSPTKDAPPVKSHLWTSVKDAPPVVSVDSFDRAPKDSTDSKDPKLVQKPQVRSKTELRRASKPERRDAAKDMAKLKHDVDLDEEDEEDDDTDGFTAVRSSKKKKKKKKNKKKKKKSQDL